jgi:hypothetical protein
MTKVPTQKELYVLGVSTAELGIKDCLKYVNEIKTTLLMLICFDFFMLVTSD